MFLYNIVSGQLALLLLINNYNNLSVRLIVLMSNAYIIHQRYQAI